jgi:sugar lactone lactonase YvrE
MWKSISLIVVVFPLLAAAALSAEPASVTRTAHVLPGVEPDGAIRLPNQWSIRPVGRQVELGDFPITLTLHPGGRWLAVLHAGYGTHEIMILDLKGRRQVLVTRVTLEQTFGGLCFSPDGSTLYAGGGEFDVIHAFRFADGTLFDHRQISIAAKKGKLIPGGLAVDPAGGRLYTACTWGHAVALVPLEGHSDSITIPLGKDSYPYNCIVDPGRKRLYVSLWNRAQLAVIDLEHRKEIAAWDTDRHPTEMVLSGDGKTLYVACANSPRVSVLDAQDGKRLETINAGLYPKVPTGNTPNSVALTPDGQLLFVANADANNVAVFNVSRPGKTRPLGFIPAGMHPTSIRYNPADKKLYIANSRGTTPRANVHGPNPLLPRNQTTREFIARLYRGTLSILDMPDEDRMIAYSKQAYLCSPLHADLSAVGTRPEGNPIPGKVGDPSPIKYCLYIIRENRTYDQVLGDMKEGNGDPNLCLFPEKITPNAHRLSREFVLLDNFYCDGEVSADGHQWSMGAYCTDFVRRMWPLTYRGSPLGKLNIYPSEGNYDAIERPAGGYLWDRCAQAGVTYRSYGEWVQDGKTPKEPAKALAKALEGHIDPWFRGFDLEYSDLKRAERFIAQLKEFEQNGQMPRLTIMRLPNDHTSGTKAGSLTPTAFLAENDLALGLVVEALSKSKFWKEMAIFVVEDDAQNGSDHVDAHRTVALAISPYSRLGKVDSSMYSTSSMLRTMELILGLRPMSQFDAAARPMYASFGSKLDPTPYQHLVAQTDLKARNLPSAFGAALSAKMNFSIEDAVDDLLLNEVIWRAVRGSDSAMPPPVHAAFVFPHLKN